jgi:hypothetical protein
MMYKILGGDQKEYGPVPSEQIRLWIAEGRASGSTLAQAEDSSDWKTLAAFPEFAEALASQFSSLLAPKLLADDLGSPDGLGPNLRIGDCLNRAWVLLRTHLRPLLLASVLVWCMSTVTLLVPIFGGIFNLAISGALFGGLFLFFLKWMRGQTPGIADVFAGFSLAFAQLTLGGIVSQLLTSIGVILCFLPGIYLTIAWVFALPLIIDKRMNFWPAMELSRRVVTRRWFQVFGLMVLAYLPLFLFHLYRFFRISSAAYGLAGSGSLFDPNQLTQISKLSASLNFYYQVILLFNLPFATAALMYAYEDIFKERPDRTA